MLAWGVGLLVGVVMAAMTPARSATLGVYAALLAMLGLATGKVLTLKIMSGSAHEVVLEHEETLAQAFLMDMRDRETFSPEVNQRLVALAEDTVPDALYATMQVEAQARMDAAPAAERERVAKQAVTMVMGSLSLPDQFMATLSLFDLLWFFLAIGTAWKIMRSE
jgi:xanthosine utilization system XapX-like protein